MKCAPSSKVSSTGRETLGRLSLLQYGVVSLFAWIVTNCRCALIWVPGKGTLSAFFLWLIPSKRADTSKSHHLPMEGSFGEALLHQFHTPEKQIIVQLEEVANLPYILNNRTKQKDG